MTPLGWTMMGVSWTFVIGVAGFLVWKSTR